MNIKKNNIYKSAPESSPNEIFEELLKTSGVRLERIISTGQSTPDGEWYNQDADEWVMLLQGSAELRFESEEILPLEPGDYVFIPAHCRHRVESTDKLRPTIWLALHMKP
ncbi:MAG: cupin domain-containing protein [Candidatus Kapaibacterium sp.]